MSDRCSPRVEWFRSWKLGVTPEELEGDCLLSGLVDMIDRNGGRDPTMIAVLIGIRIL